MNIKKILAMTATCVALLLTACGGGGGGDSVANPVNGTLGGTAAVGNPIVGGTVKVICAGGSAVSGATTSNVGAWQVTLAGQGMPCAVQVSGGTINGVANATPYHSIAVALGTANITTLTDLMVANVVGSATPSTWFAGLTSSAAALGSIGQAQLDVALTKLRAALTALPPLASVHPITTSFTPTPGNVSDDMLAALQLAMKATGIPYATLLNSAAAAAFTAPASSLASAMTSAYLGTVSGTPAITIPAAPTGVTATANSTSQINVNWSNVSGAASYNVYRASSPSVQLVVANKISPIGSLLTAGPFSNTGLTSATSYYYRVTAVNSAGESIGSAEVSATTASVVPAPTVIGFLPATGAPGTSVTISGTNFSSFTPTPLVKFGGTTATSTLISGQSVQTAVPAGVAVGNSTITIANGDGTGSITVGTFTVTDGTGGTSSQQMGGAIQGTPLNLTTAVTTLAGYVSAIPVTIVDGTGAAASFYLPYGVTTDGTNLYVVDNSSIRKIVIATGVVTTLAGTKLGASGSTDGTGTVARFALARGITTDGTNLYVADTGNNAIRKIVIATGAVTTLAGGAFGSTDGPGTAAQFYSPSGITTDGTNLYVADTLNTTVRKVVIATGAVTTLASTGWGTTGWGSAGVDGTGAAARFARPQGITSDGTNLYVSDIVSTTIHRIQ